MNPSAKPPAPDTAIQLRQLLTRLITEGAHHNRCADLSRIDEARTAHSAFAAGFRLAAMYTADILATGNLQWHNAHPAEPADETVAQHLLDHLPDNPVDRAHAIHQAIHGDTTDSALQART